MTPIPGTMWPVCSSPYSVTGCPGGVIGRAWAAGRIIAGLILVGAAGWGADWPTVTVPGSWEDQAPAMAATYDGVAWYRTWVKVPDNFFRDASAYERVKYAETVGVVVREIADAHEVFVNGLKIGASGRFPPNFASVRDETRRYKVPFGTLRKGEWNEVAVRVYNASGPGGFLGAAPVLMNIMTQCVLEGRWEFRIGDDYRPGGARSTRPETSAFDQFQTANFVLGRMTTLDGGPRMTPAASLAAMKVPDDLTIELMLHEPEVTQPTHLSFDERGRLWVTQYNQYPYPAGLKVIGHAPGREAIYDRVPPAPPNHDRGADIISIHEDTDGDGRFDMRTVFQDGLNLASSAYVSGDGRSVFIGVPGMKPVMQMRAGWSLVTADGQAFEENAFFSPRELAPFMPGREGFSPDLKVDLEPRTVAVADRGPVSVEEGRRLTVLMGCTGCHTTDGADLKKIGPSWKGIFGTIRPLSGGEKVLADEAYIRESILDPAARRVAGFDKDDHAMPNYSGVLNEAQLESVIRYIKSLQ